MAGRFAWLAASFAAVFCHSFQTMAAADVPLSSATIVVYNSTQSESLELAKFYAQQRGIAREHLVGLACPSDEEISREDYDNTIALPLREIFRERKWWVLRESEEQKLSVASNSIRFVALIKGMPLKVRATAAPYPGDTPGNGPIGNRNEASVDAEISLLGAFTPQISGAFPNPYFQSYRAITEGEFPAEMLVCRLDAPAASTVRRMITDAIETEKSGLWGRAFVDGAHNTSGGLQMGDAWLAEIPGQLRKVGVPVVYEDTPAIFPEGYPISDCALYYGWYASTAAGPFIEPGFRFTPGAIAVHIHSFSANTLRNPNANWVGPLLTQGAAASIGNVYEPYLQLTSHLNILNDRLLHGFTFAESAYMSVQALSWMTVVVGDPLYRPYGAWLQIDAKRESARGVSDWKMYHDFALKNGSRPPADFRTAARETASRSRNGPMLEDLGLIEAGEGHYGFATAYFQQARGVYTKRADILRVVLEEADGWIKQNKPKRALELIRPVLKVVSDAPTAALFRKIESDIRMPAAKSPAPKP